MKRIDCFILFINAEQVKNTVAGLKACDLVHNIYLLAGADAQGEVEGCEKIAIGNLNSSDTMKKIAAKADCDYAMLYTKYNSLEFGMFAVERMVKIADDSAAGMAYADHYNVVGDQRSNAPVIDYQQGSLRDDFDFGSVLLFNAAALKSAVAKIDKEYDFAGLYDVRLKITQEAELVHINEYLYSDVELDTRKSGEKTRLLIYPWGRKNMDYTEDFANHYDGAFKYCSEIVAFNLKSGDFPVREMLNFPNLKSVTVEPSTRYKVIDDIVYEKGWTDEECGALVCYPEYRASFETLTIENSWLPYAFYGKYPTLRTVIIPRTITEIKGLLPNAENLLKIVCESTTPPTLDEESLQYTRKKFGAIVVVPKGASSNYKKADYWKEFNIIEYDSVDDVADGAVVVAADGRMLMVAGADGQRIDVFSADGRQVYSGTDSSVELPQAGVYVVRTGAVVKKIAVR